MTEVSRRNVVRVGAAAAVATPLLPTDSALAWTRPTPRALYKRSRFALLRGKTFRLDGVTGARLTLVRVRDLPLAPARDQGRFVLTFRAAGARPEQGSYQFRRSGFIPTKLFIVPSDADRDTYEAVVNRI